MGAIIQGTRPKVYQKRMTDLNESINELLKKDILTARDIDRIRGVIFQAKEYGLRYEAYRALEDKISINNPDAGLVITRRK